MTLIGNSVYTGNAVEVQGNAYIGTHNAADGITQYYDWTSFTPVSATQTLNTNVCSYCQVGDEVFVNCNIVITSFTPPDVNSFTLTGLPKAAASSSAYKTFRMVASDILTKYCQVSFSGTSMTFTRCSNTDFGATASYTLRFQASYKNA